MISCQQVFGSVCRFDFLVSNSEKLLTGAVLDIVGLLVFPLNQEKTLTAKKYSKITTSHITQTSLEEERSHISDLQQKQKS